jgi:outer membrane protein OmpA-like peptidoglycan-associated protein
VPLPEPGATATPSPPRIVICNDCGVSPIAGIGMIHFQQASAAVSAEAEPVLQAVANVMQAHPEVWIVTVEGHADVDETRRITGDVSRRRAAAVRDQLVAKGVEPGRLVVVAYGNTRPLDNSGTAAGRLRNRRVQFRVEERRGP